MARRKTRRSRRHLSGLDGTKAQHKRRALSTSKHIRTALKSFSAALKRGDCQRAVGELRSAAYYSGRFHVDFDNVRHERVEGNSGAGAAIFQAEKKFIRACLVG